MKKLFSILLIFLLSLSLSACNEDNEKVVEDYVEIFHLNDFHGALESTSDYLGIANIANLVNTTYEETPENTLFILSGDILQGSAASNYYDGLSTITLLNMMNVTAFTLGNHEFDWGLDTIAQYKDGNPDNGEANFPFLGANIYYKGTENRPDWIEPYTIVERGTHKIGIIGVMGYGLERSIAQSKIDDYEFGSPTESVRYYSEYLRGTENCDIIIVSSHSGSSINNTIIGYPEEARVDAIFNGHTHSTYQEVTNGVAEVQSGSKGKFVGYVKLDFTTGEKVVTAENWDSYDNGLLDSTDDEVLAKLNTYLTEIDELLGDEILVSGEGYSTGELSWWLTDLIRHSTNADIVFHNFGGTRASIRSNDSISMSTIYEIWPFDNTVKLTFLKGESINTLIKGDLAFSSEITEFDSQTYYLVATNDYLFDKDTNPFKDGLNPTYSGVLLRDLVAAELLLQAESYSDFLTTNDFLLNPSDYFTQDLTIE